MEKRLVFNQQALLYAIATGDATYARKTYEDTYNMLYENQRRDIKKLVDLYQNIFGQS